VHASGKKQRTHFLAVAIFEIFTMCGSPGVVVIISRTRGKEEREREMSLSPFALASRSFRIKIGRVFSLLQMICIIFLALSFVSVFSFSIFSLPFLRGESFVGAVCL